MGVWFARWRMAMHPALALVLMVVGIWALAAARWFLADMVVPWDSKNQSYAFFRFLASSLHSGAAPFWNPFHYGGHPAVADPQSFIFAPAFVAWALFDPAPSMRAFDLVVYAHLLVGGLAVGAIGCRAGWPAAACVMAAAVFMFGGPASGRLQHTGAIVAYGLFPLALLLLQIALQRRSYAAAIGGALVAAMLIVGRNQIALLLGVVLLAAALAQILSAEHPMRFLRTRAPVLAAMCAITLALIAVPVLLTLQFAELSNRPAVAIAQALEASLHPTNFATLGIANIFGSNIWPSAAWPYPYWGPNYDTLPEVGATDLSFNYLFVGLSTVVVLLWMGACGGGLLRSGRRFLTAVLVVAALFMLGRYTPLYTWAFDWAPGIAQFRRPVDASFVFVAALSLLIGHLLTDYVREGLPRRSLAWSLMAIGVAGGVLAWAVVFSGRSSRTSETLIEVLKVAPIAAAVIVALAWAKTADARRWTAAAIAALAVAELLWWNTASRLNAEERERYAVLERAGGTDAETLAVVERAVAAEQAAGLRPRIEVIGVGGPWQNLASVVGLEATTGYNPLRIGRYDRLVSPGETTYRADQRLFPRSFEGYDCALARALGLHYLVVGQPIETLDRLANKPVAEVLQAGPSIWVYRLGNPLPRVSFNSRVVVADTDAVTSTGQLNVEPSAERVLIEGEVPSARTYLSGTGQARLISWRSDRVEVEAQSAQGGVLVLHDLYYPGWVAEIDGAATAVLRANVLFRAVEVPPGRRRIVFRYAPFSLDNLASALTAALSRRRRPTPAPQ
jgi:hypothetical protein